ncbi:MAG: NTP transferase domain-containing protein [Cyclobacteriaceae bacterium]|nr:NTP transferase domain-containing protein [Cyclobacteriaceae bacterium]
MKPTLLVLAAGMGSRYGGLKQADQVGPNGETIIDYSIYDAIQAGFGKVVLVVRQNILDEMKALFDPKWGNKIQLEYAIQEVNVPIEGISNLPERKKPWGTGHAVMVAKQLVKEPFAVINADDFYGADAFKTMSRFLQDGVSDNENAMVGYILKNTLSDHGYVSRGICETDSKNYLKTVTERTNIERVDGEVVFTEKDGSQHALDENSYVSMNFWGFSTNFFTEAESQFKEFVTQNTDNEKAEFFIPLIVGNLMNAGKLKVKVLESTAQWMGVTYKEDKPVVTEKISQLVKAGLYPEKLV